MEQRDQLFTVSALAHQLDLPRATVDYWRKAGLLQPVENDSGSRLLYPILELQIGRFLKYFLILKADVKVLKILANAFRSVLNRTAGAVLERMFEPVLAKATEGWPSLMAMHIHPNLEVDVFATLIPKKLLETISTCPSFVPIIIVDLAEIMMPPE